MRVGLDIGSTTIKCVVLDEHDALLYSTYERHYSHILEKAQELLLSLIHIFCGAQKRYACSPKMCIRDRHNIDAKAAGEDIRKQVAKLSLLRALRVGQLPAEAPYDVAVLFVHLTGEAVQHLLHGGVAGARCV